MDRRVALQRVAEETERRRQAAETYDGVDADWRAAIKAALASGCPRSEIAAEANVGRQRVWQIEHDTR